LENVLVVDANARLGGRRLATLDVIGVGPRLVAALLKHYGFSASLQPYENVVGNRSLVKRFDVLAVSFMVSDTVAVKRLIDFWRKAKDGRGLVVLGGPGALSRKALETLDFDLALLGEAEPTLYEIFARHGLGSFSEAIEYLRSRCSPIRGTAIKMGGRVVEGGLAPWTPSNMLFRVAPEVEDIRNYPFYWACRVYVEVVRGCSNFRRPRGLKEVGICSGCGLCEAGRLSDRIGCPAGIPPGCGYCSVPLVHGYPRSRDVHSVAEEVRALLNMGVTRVVLSAPDFLDYGRELGLGEPLTDPCSPPANVEAIEALLVELASIEQISDGRASLMVENVKACLVDESVARLLGRYLRGTAIYIGLESCSDRLLEAVGRPSRCRDVLNAVELLSRNGLRPYVYIMYRMPLERPEDLSETARVVPRLESIGVERVVLYRFRPLPRTAFEKAAEPPDPQHLEHAEELKKTVKSFNERAKTRLVGRILDVVIASEYPRSRGYLVSYPLAHGPVVLVRASKRFVGCIARVRITRVVSDRVVLGTLLHTRYRVWSGAA